MRSDAIGLWWDDTPPPKPPKKETVKRTPPARTWEADDYLPGLNEALAFDVQQFDRTALYDAYLRREPLLFDIECYKNFFQIAFMSYVTGKVVDFIQTDVSSLDRETVKWILYNFLVVGFNSYSYDIPMASLAIAGCSCAQLKEASDAIIVNEERPQDVLRHYKAKNLRDHIDHIDLIEVAPLRGSLKIYGGRLHVPRMQDLPFQVNRYLTGAQMAIVRWYCVNDLVGTGFLNAALQDQLKLRITLSEETGLDLRSRSDAQIAEAVITDALYRMSGVRPRKPEIPPGTTYSYHVPAYMQFKTPLLYWVLERIKRTPFIVSLEGRIGIPQELLDMELRIADGVYRMGIGGLHSSESTVAHIASDDMIVDDNDVESFYPRIILNQQLYPKHLGREFLTVYEQIVTRRIAAKRRGDKVVADSLKITINGSYGKLGSPYSALYAPDLLIQVTITGQLTLLMLIEAFELAGITVASANTDGIVVRYRKEQKELKASIIKEWEATTGFRIETTDYKALYCRDVNNYIAVKYDGTTKAKGVFANPWGTTKNKEERLWKNPTSQICIDAVTALLTKGTPVDHTVRLCTDITKFVCVRNVKGGAVKDGVYLGKSIRWYYAKGVEGEIVYASTGNKVPRSEGARPAMDLPTSLPDDIDFDRYVAETEKILVSIAYV